MINKPPQRWGRNLLKNPSFEDWNQNVVGSWRTEVDGTSEITEDTSVYYDKTSSIKAYTGPADIAKIDQLISIDVGDKVQIKFWHRCTDLLPIRFRTYEGVSAGTTNVQLTVTTINTWEQYEVEITWGANDTGIYFLNNSSSYTWWIDKVEVRVYKVIPTFDLEGIDSKIQLLQLALEDNLSWLQYSFGKCERHEKIIEGTKEVYPVCFVDNTTDPIDVRPNDNYESMSFWEVQDPGRISYDDEYAIRKYAMWEYDVSLIIWANLKRIDSSHYNETKSRMRQDIIDVFETKLVGSDVTFWVEQIFEKDILQIFVGYDLNNEENIIKRPFVAFRINGIIRFKRKCPVSNTYSVKTSN